MALKLQFVAKFNFALKKYVSQVLRYLAVESETNIKRGAPVDKGYLREHWRSEVDEPNNRVILSNSTSYAPYHTFGTGIYGPEHRMIRPIRAKMLHWINKEGHHVFAKQVRGIKPNPYVQDGVAEAIRTTVQEMNEQYGNR